MERASQSEASNNKEQLERAQTPSALRAMRASRGENNKTGTRDFAEMEVLVYDDPKQRAEVERARVEKDSRSSSRASRSASRSMSREPQAITVVNEVNEIQPAGTEDQKQVRKV